MLVQQSLRLHVEVCLLPLQVCFIYKHGFIAEFSNTNSIARIQPTKHVAKTSVVLSSSAADVPAPAPSSTSAVKPKACKKRRRKRSQGMI
ncbi:hypothetical protein SNOG_03860 [Parastagonospora nodorum SN15]|uniref:Uncharacterized protein n=1 Tax=Phaeosphaeria nodorum (strain SN15 / ATCC MYA-4574 / FGSC 10173) TaxID=321614 RepID=Q0UWK4_PHANO|nr:hypothetical protein SNOG_03860 [Parastagonospora nodorum SN15]EAT89065.1 hypothetical protein SNOG_03860 [Parastagonospora nodorum SN15]